MSFFLTREKVYAGDGKARGATDNGDRRQESVRRKKSRKKKKIKKKKTEKKNAKKENILRRRTSSATSCANPAADNATQHSWEQLHAHLNFVVAHYVRGYCRFE